ncbi:MAG: 5-(carboxyamino)imidazole ribonucleotide mutase [Candidatus Krumholzibacteriota bacterium]|nr:5-(carboxyamino)imidazole ribonucleotide mutase [Candidatus Krumholzibacteriota bacterium]
MSTKLQVAVVMGSESDRETMELCLAELEKFHIAAEIVVSSAHRMPEKTRDYVVEAEERGAKVFIAGAGMAAALPGFVASVTTKPVIGVPLASGLPGGLDALLAIVQMPPGVPVATVAVGKAGARNAAILAAEILAIGDDGLRKRLDELREQWRNK